MSSIRPFAAPALAGALFAAFAFAGPGAIPEWEGPTAIRGLTIVPRPGETIENGTIVIVNGRTWSDRRGCADGARELMARG